ncbi:MAG: Y-family DNA polymerase [Prevotella sp.]|nr:Y-family DNA polymerase [Prevotella sp.]
MWALADCNSFFCSVEKVFHAGLEGKPVCVLSSNDGNIVALTPEAKALGLKRGDPVFKVKDVIERHDVRLFSSNMRLYAAMSKRVVSIMRRFVAQVEQYSIDECFCNLSGYEETRDLVQYMREMAATVKLWTDIPISIGIAPSKTLAKVGSKFAKKYKGYASVCIIDTEEKRRKALELTELEDIWGIGRSTLARLNYLGITTPLQFAEMSEGWVKRHFNLPAQQTWRELNGIACIKTDEVAAKQSICTSRSFGEMTSLKEDMRSAVASYAASCANKLRAQQSVAGAVTVFVMTNRFREDLKQYNNEATETFLVHTCDTVEITQAAWRALDRIFLPGIMYKKAGVVLSGITPKDAICLNLFDEIRNRPERMKLMETIDTINGRYGTKTVTLAATGEKEEKWHCKSCLRSDDFLTDINGLLVVKA